MERLRKLKGERSKLLSKAKEIAETAAKEDGGRPLSEEERTQINEAKSKIEAIDAEIKTLESIIELERSAPAQTVDIIHDGGQTSDNKLPNVTGGEDRALQDPLRGFPDYKSGGLGVFLHAVIQAGRQNRNDPIINGRRETRLVPLEAVAGSDEQRGVSQIFGGFTVPVGFIAQLFMLEPEGDPTAGVTEVPMAVPSVNIPARVDKNHSASVSGGITVSWRPETVALSSSLMTLEQISLVAHSLGGISYVSEELLNDSAISWAATLQAGFRDAVLDAIIRARISGTGVGEPLGILNSPALISVDTTGQTTGTITGANILAMRQRVWKYGRAVWLANHDTYTQVASAHVAHTQSDSPLFNPARGIDVPDTLLGRPIIFTEYAKSLSTVGDIMCVVWSEYLAGRLQGFQMAESMHVRFVNNERTFRFTARLAGEPWWRSALTPVNSTETLSPFVALATRTT